MPLAWSPKAAVRRYDAYAACCLSSLGWAVRRISRGVAQSRNVAVCRTRPMTGAVARFVTAVVGPEALESPNSLAVWRVVGTDMEKAKTITRSEGLSKLELTLIADSLATAASEFSDRSCNDFSFPATPEHKAVGEAIVRHREPGYWGKTTHSPIFSPEWLRRKNG